jgi:hypothetical protein
MKMVERYHYLQCSAQYGLCVSLKAFKRLFACLFLFVSFPPRSMELLDLMGLNFVL